MENPRREMDAPFTKSEHRFILAEMIKTSSIDIYQLDGFVKSQGITPDWMSMQLPQGRNMNECILAAKQLSMSNYTRTRHSSGSSGSCHGSYPPICHSMNSPPTLQPSIHPPHPPSYHGGVSILPRPVVNGLMQGPPTVATTVVKPTDGSSRTQKSSHAATETPRPAPKKRGRPSRADRAKRELRPLLPQHLMPRPPLEQQQQQQQLYTPPSVQYTQQPLLPSAVHMQQLCQANALPSEAARNIKKRRRNATPERLPSVDDIMAVPPPRKAD